jgi:TetR/AcrR family transcriptional regulator
MPNNSKTSRKELILRSLARMLETSPGTRITTASLADQVGVSEAALYRHFPSKTKMFDDLIKFIEETLFSRISRVLKEEQSTDVRCYKILTLILTFCEKNPGLTRLLTGDALVGETEALRMRISRFYGRIESQLKQVLREAQIRENLRPSASPAAIANLLLASAEGRLLQFVRSEFKQSPLENWDIQWSFLSKNLLMPFQLD